MGSQFKTIPEYILRIEEVSVNFDGFFALTDLNFEMERGELRVVIGPNGAGKTTLLDVITGKVRPTSGKVIFQPDGQPARNITGAPQEQIVRMGVGRKFQTPNVFKSLSVIENLRLSMQSPRGVMASLTAAWTQDGKERTHDILQTIGLTAKAHVIAGILAHGEKQWLELGMLMAQDPELLLVDEPVAGMTPRESERTGELLIAMKKRHSLLVIEHDMTFVKQIASTVTVLHEGKTLSQGRIGQVQRDPRVIEVYLGEDREDAEAHINELDEAEAVAVKPRF